MQNEGWKGKLTLSYSESQLNCCIQQCTFFLQRFYSIKHLVQFKIFLYIYKLSAQRLSDDTLSKSQSYHSRDD